MKLKIVGGTLEVEIVEGSMSVDDVKGMLKKLAVAQEEETTTGIKQAGVSPHSSKSKMHDKLNAKARMPI